MLIIDLLLLFIIDLLLLTIYQLRGNTAILWATNKNNETNVKTLLKKGANPLIENNVSE